MRLEACLHKLKLWLTNNFMLLNNNKTQIIQFGPNDRSIDLGTLTPYLTSDIKTFYLDSTLKLDKQINGVVSFTTYAS